MIVKFSSYKAKAAVLMKRRALKGTGITIAEYMAPEIAKRLKKLKNISRKCVVCERQDSV